MEIELISISKINPAPYNPRKDLRPGDPEYEKLKRSIQEFGLVDPLIWNKRTGNLVGGHQRLKILQEMGHTEAHASIVDLDDQREKALNIALNKISGDWDISLLKDLLEELDDGTIDIGITGFDADEIDNLMAQFHDPDEIAEDAPPEPPDDPTTEPGDLWLLGKHRLLCGDATIVTDAERLMAGSLADMMFTDPPYNVNYGEKAAMLDEYQKGHRNTDSIKNDNMASNEFLLFLTDTFRNAYAALSPGGAFYICHAESTGLEFRQAVQEAGLLLKQCIIWAKNSIVMGRQDYQWKHEPILYGWKPGAAHNWFGGRKTSTIIEDNAQIVFEEKKDHTVIHVSHGLQQMAIKVPSYEVEASVDDALTTVWRVEKPLKNDVHPTMKPVNLCARGIRNSCPRNGIVLDLFGGSGSTLIACEQLNRACYMMELDPKYCDVILNRYINFKESADDVFLVKNNGEEIPYKELNR